MSILFGLRHPQSVRGLLLLRVTGGEFAARRLPENYYGQFIRAAADGGMAAVCATDQYRERIAANPANHDQLMGMDAGDFIDAMTRLRDLFEEGAHWPVMGVDEAELAKMDIPTIVIPGNDNTHSSESGRVAHRLIPGSVLHELPIEDQDEIGLIKRSLNLDPVKLQAYIAWVAENWPEEFASLNEAAEQAASWRTDAAE